MKAVKIISRLFFVLLPAFSIFAVSAQNKENTQSNAKTENAGIQKPVDSTTNRNSSNTQINERYRIGFQDTLEISVFNQPKLSQTTTVNPDGTINLPRINQPIEAVCKTEGELKEIITALYKKDYLRDPFVTVRVSDQKSQGFAVIGAIQKPGNYYISRRVSLLELLSLAGGQDVEFAGGKIQVARVGSVAGCRDKNEASDGDGNFEFLSFNLRDVLEGKKNPWMQPGDIVSVLKAEEAYITGEVFKPTKILLDEPKTLTQALASAGGLSTTAKTDKVVIQRQASEGSPSTDLVFNLKDIRNRKIPDPQLQANDIIDVGTDKLKSFKKGLFKTITGSIPSAVYRF